MPVSPVPPTLATMLVETPEESTNGAGDWHHALPTRAPMPGRYAIGEVRPARTQFLRFGLVGVLNTAIDMLALNVLLQVFAVRTLPGVLLANAGAYALGASNSFVLNKRWTFGRTNPTTTREAGRFALTTLAGIALNDALLAGFGHLLLPLLGATALWANVVKLCAIGGTVGVSFVGMRCWVFARRALVPTSSAVPSPDVSAPVGGPRQPGRLAREPRDGAARAILARHSISVVLPAYNEEAAILTTLAQVSHTLAAWDATYEVIVVDDGSADRTGALVAAYASADLHVRLVRHDVNRGYGAALGSGFAAARCDLTFFMDSDGQFAIADLARLLPLIERYAAVLGYRERRRDAWPRLLNAWGWKVAVWLALGVRVRDLDCAFKLFHTAFLRAYPPTTASALVNAQLVDTLNRTGAAYCQVGVRHLPRRTGRATGASPRVILRALRDLGRFTWSRRSQPLPAAARR